MNPDTSRRGRCPVCGSDSECAGQAAAPLTYPPVDFPAVRAEPTGPLRTYRVTVRAVTTTMRLNDTDAASYGDAAVLI